MSNPNHDARGEFSSGGAGGASKLVGRGKKSGGKALGAIQRHTGPSKGALVASKEASQFSDLHSAQAAHGNAVDALSYAERGNYTSAATSHEAAAGHHKAAMRSVPTASEQEAHREAAAAHMSAAKELRAQGGARISKQDSSKPAIESPKNITGAHYQEPVEEGQAHTVSTQMKTGGRYEDTKGTAQSLESLAKAHGAHETIHDIGGGSNDVHADFKSKEDAHRFLAAVKARNSGAPAAVASPAIGAADGKALTREALNKTHADRQMSPEAQKASKYASGAAKHRARGNHLEAAADHARAAKQHEALASMSTSDHERMAHQTAATHHIGEAAKLRSTAGGKSEVIARGKDLSKSPVHSQVIGLSPSHPNAPKAAAYRPQSFGGVPLQTKNVYSETANQASKNADNATARSHSRGTSGAHMNAASEHGIAAQEHERAAGMTTSATDRANHNSKAAFHRSMQSRHDREANLVRKMRG